MTMKPFHVTLRLRNNLLRERRVELGMTCKAMAQAIGISITSYCDIEGMRQRSPIYNRGRGRWSSTAMKIAAFHGLSPEELWPAEILIVESPKAERVFDMAEVEMLMSEGQAIMGLLPDAVAEERERVGVVRQAMATLLPNEERAITRVFGLDGGDEPVDWKDVGSGLQRTRTFDGHDGQLSKQRVKQIYDRGMRRLAHWSRSRALEQVYVEPVKEWPTDVLWCMRCSRWVNWRHCGEGNRTRCGEEDLRHFHKVTGRAVAGDRVLIAGGPYYREVFEEG